VKFFQFAVGDLGDPAFFGIDGVDQDLAAHAIFLEGFSTII
jgi:hypothetical protein